MPSGEVSAPAPETAAQTKRHTRQRGTCWDSPVTVSHLLLLVWTFGSGPPGPDASSTGSLLIFASSQGTALAPQVEREHLEIVRAGDSPFPGVLCRLFLWNYHPLCFSPAITRKLILPTISIITVSLPPINPGTWPRFLETRPVLANIGRIMPTTRHYLQETTTVVA